jgi:ribosome-binding factor A
MKRQRNRRARGQYRFAHASDDHDLYCDYFKHNKADHKTAQLCRQVLRTLTMALADCADDVIRELTVLDVVPAPDATRLLVTVAAYGMNAETGTGGVFRPGIGVELMARLLAATPHLRREIAGAITRKRVPELMFQVVSEPEGRS